MWLSSAISALWERIGIWKTKNGSSIVFDTADQISEKVDDTSIELTGDEIKELIKERDARIFLYVLEKINGSTFISNRKFVNNMWETITETWEWIQVLDINTEKAVNTLTFTVLDSSGNNKRQEFTFADGVFFYNSKWCFEDIEELFNLAEQEIPKTW